MRDILVSSKLGDISLLLVVHIARIYDMSAPRSGIRRNHSLCSAHNFTILRAPSGD